MVKNDRRASVDTQQQEEVVTDSLSVPGENHRKRRRNEDESQVSFYSKHFYFLQEEGLSPRDREIDYLLSTEYFLSTSPWDPHLNPDSIKLPLES